MFEGGVMGLSPQAAAQLTALVEQYRPVFNNQGLEAVQSMLAEDGVSMIQSIMITRALLGWAETPLRVAIDTVAASTVRAKRRDDAAA